MKGHSGNIEDLAFRPESSNELVSVGIDRYVLFWDTRVGSGAGKGNIKPV